MQVCYKSYPYVVFYYTLKFTVSTSLAELLMLCRFISTDNIIKHIYIPEGSQDKPDFYAHHLGEWPLTSFLPRI